MSLGPAEFLAEARSRTALMACLVMTSWAGLKVRESDGPNRGPVVDAIHELAGGDDEDAAFWCARSIIAAWRTAGWATQQDIDPRISRSGSVFHLLHDTARRAPGQVLWTHEITDPVAQILPGDAMICYLLKRSYDPAKPLTRADTQAGHTEMVTRPYADGRIDTIGGNTGSQVDRDGDGVYIHRAKYHMSDGQVVGFVRPLWVPIDAENGR